ncbi:MAG TPA: general secretion pathway protein GspB, partial [Ramlibacter sp.]|nr:general secretion pathway protein GspB [Ramlibacter sp.]
ATPAPATPAPATPAPARVANPNPAQPTPPGTDRILAVGELPPGVQSDLPKLKISGGVHSEDPAQRLLIVAGQVVHEGAELAPGVVLEQIRPRSAVLRFRGYRYSIVY